MEPPRQFDQDPALFNESTPTIDILNTYIAMRDQWASKNDRALGILLDELVHRMAQRDVWADLRAGEDKPLVVSPWTERAMQHAANMSDEWKADVFVGGDFLAEYLGRVDLQPKGLP